jgi:hypothetical protein
MTIPDEQRGPIFTNFFLDRFEEIPTYAGAPENYWAGEAYYWSGSQEIKDSIMAVKEEYRADQFLLWAADGFSHEGDSGDTETRWGDKAYEICGGGSQG